MAGNALADLLTSTVSFVEVLLDSLSILISPGTVKRKHCLYWTVTAHAKRYAQAAEQR